MVKLRKLIKEHSWDREFGDPLPTFEDVMGKHQVNKLKEDWWDNMSPEDKAEYIQAHPGSQKAQDAKAKEKEEPKGKRSDRYADVDTSWHDDPEASAAQDWGQSGGMWPGQSQDKPKSEPKPEEPEKQQDTTPSPASTRTGDESTEELGDMIKQQQNHIEDMAERGEPEEDIQAAEADREEMEQEMEEKEAAGGEEPSYEPTGPSSAYGPEWGDDPQASPGYTRSSRTGDELDDDELNQETLMVNGKKYRRISESVEQKPKPKYEFSEFYERFKR